MRGADLVARELASTPFAAYVRESHIQLPPHLLPFLQPQPRDSQLSPCGFFGALSFTGPGCHGVLLHSSVFSGTLWPVGLDSGHPLGVMAIGCSSDSHFLDAAVHHPQAGPAGLLSCLPAHRQCCCAAPHSQSDSDVGSLAAQGLAVYAFDTWTMTWRPGLAFTTANGGTGVRVHGAREVRLSSDSSLAAALFSGVTGTRRQRSIVVWTMPGGPFCSVPAMGPLTFAWLPGKHCLLLLTSTRLACATIHHTGSHHSVEPRYSSPLLLTYGAAAAFDVVPPGSAALVLQHSQVAGDSSVLQYRLTLFSAPDLALMTASTFFYTSDNESPHAMPASVHCCQTAAAVCLPGRSTRIHALHPLWEAHSQLRFTLSSFVA